ncbi:MAG TPA: hypothetical protein VKC99_10345 [Methyloceanibacter sp.]|nr:hypothetical protein [Methyloceanibacter sp.]
MTALDTQAMTLGSDGEPMALGYANEPAGAPPPAYGPGLVFWTNAFGALGRSRRQQECRFR